MSEASGNEVSAGNPGADNRATSPGDPVAGRDLAEAMLDAFSGDAAALLDFLGDPALIVAHDVPFPLGREAFADHLGFQADNWERVETLFHHVETREHGDTGIFSAYFIQRGKPRDAGFRLRAGYCTAVCARRDGAWRALALHLSPLSSQILDASPG